MALERLLTPAEVADLARLSTLSVYRAIRAGRLRASKLGRRLRLSEVDVRTWLHEAAHPFARRQVEPRKGSS